MAHLLFQQQTFDHIDLIIHSGHVIDPANNINGLFDVIIVDTRVVGVVLKTTSEQRSLSKELHDATGCFVTPGLIDLHAHVYQHSTPLGIDPDTHCLFKGVTTVVDAGSSGATTFAGLREFIAKKSTTRVLCFIHICMHGLASAGCSGFGTGGELDSLNQVDEVQASECLEKNSDMVVGVKIRLSADCAADGENEIEAFRRARAVTHAAKKPLIVHHTFSSIPHEGPEGALGSLRRGDIYTHSLHGFPSSLIQVKSREEDATAGDAAAEASSQSATTATTKKYMVRQAAREARERGVLFDVGHGAGSFSWKVAEICAAENFYPDTISTDLHVESCGSPCYDLCIAASKMMHVGMSLFDVVAAMTSTPARAIGWEDRIGSLTHGYLADITVLQKDVFDKPQLVEDCQGQLYCQTCTTRRRR